MSQLQQKQSRPRVIGLTGATPVAVAGLVDTQVNALNLLLNQPALNATTGVANTPGNVMNGTIAVSDITATFITNIGTQYIATVHWSELVTPA